CCGPRSSPSGLRPTSGASPSCSSATIGRPEFRCSPRSRAPSARPGPSRSTPPGSSRLPSCSASSCPGPTSPWPLRPASASSASRSGCAGARTPGARSRCSSSRASTCSRCSRASSCPRSAERRRREGALRNARVAGDHGDLPRAVLRHLAAFLLLPGRPLGGLVAHAGWSLDPVVLAAAGVAVVGFARGFRRLRRRGRADLAGWGRAVVFGLAVALGLLALLSPLDAVAEDELLSAHMLQHVVIGDLVPLLLVLALRGPLLFFVVPPRLGRVVAGIGPVPAFAFWLAALGV